MGLLSLSFFGLWILGIVAAQPKTEPREGVFVSLSTIINNFMTNYFWATYNCFLLLLV